MAPTDMALLNPVTGVVDVQCPTVVYAWPPQRVVLLLVGVVPFPG